MMLHLILAFAVLASPQTLADPDDFRCFKSINHQPPIRLEIAFTDAKGGLVTYEHGHGRIPVVLTDNTVVHATQDRPDETIMRWTEDSTVGAGGEYVMISQGARVFAFRYVRKKDGKVFQFEEDLEASGENSCTWDP